MNWNASYWKIENIKLELVSRKGRKIGHGNLLRYDPSTKNKLDHKKRLEYI